MRIKKLDERVQLLWELIEYSNGGKRKYEEVGPWEVSPHDLSGHTMLCQATVKLPIYTVAHAAAWLGLSKRGVVEAYRAKRLPFIQPGREVLFLHEDLVEFAKSRRYNL
jgi:excisionase family DNA binding protein